MQEDWLKDIHNKMSDYEVDEPRDLWDNICRARRQEEQLKHKVVVLLWTKRIAVVAAMVVLVFSVGYLTKKDKEMLPIALTMTDANVTSAGVKEQSRSLPDVSEEKRLGSAGSTHFRILARKQLAEAAPIVQTSAEAMADTLSVAEKSFPETKEHTSDEVCEAHQYKQQYDKGNRKANTNNCIAQVNIGKNNSGRLSCEMFMTGGTSSVFNRKFIGGVSDVGIGPDDSNWEDSPLLGILLYNDGKEVETDIKYRMPVRAGISFAYRINERFSLGSGVTYTNLTSDMREGSNSHYFTGEQTLHYVGIPLNMRYNIVSWKGLELYASSGLLAEKCVSGKLKKEYILNNQVVKEETQNLNEKPFQWSINASAGLQYNITPSIGLYAEPGVSYYIKDGTSLKTIYKDKPFNFNLNLGLRFTFGNK
ncbi:outer membrane beta-barrel protein [Bacteroides caecimuris]|jgi:hypothetical protein|uniref:outer membrane beta-barrel protein n=1 Tax=Bacteroides caecimuris TaxID=1796613 RepID=UPI0025AFCFED|nr:outer membrane beta-barrel protein [Bacteroides caecimuris]